MRNFLTQFLFILALSAAGMWGLPALAAEGEAAPAAASPPAPAASSDAKTDKPDAAKPKEEKKEEGGGEASKKKGSADISGGRFAGDPVYVHIAPMVLPVITDEGVEQLVTVIVDVEVKDFDVADNMHTNMPRVQDALMRALYGGLGQGSLRNGNMVDVNKIKAKATAALNEVLGAESIREVLIQGIGQRML